MRICPYCKNENPDSNKFCTSCGAPLEDIKPQESTPEAPVMEETEVAVNDHQPEAEQSSAPNDSQVTSPFDPPPVSYQNYQQEVQPIPIGGYIAWAVFNILFCTIPGAIGLYFVFKINKSTTVEEQQKNLDYAKKALIIGTVLAVLNLISQFASNF